MGGEGLGGEEGAVRTGEVGFGRVNGRGSGGEDSVGKGAIKELLDSRSVEGCEGGPIVVRCHDAVCQEWRYSWEETGLEFVDWT